MLESALQELLFRKGIHYVNGKRSPISRDRWELPPLPLYFASIIEIHYAKCPELHGWFVPDEQEGVPSGVRLDDEDQFDVPEKEWQSVPFSDGALQQSEDPTINTRYEYRIRFADFYCSTFEDVYTDLCSLVRLLRLPKKYNNLTHTCHIPQQTNEQQLQYIKNNILDGKPPQARSSVGIGLPPVPFLTFEEICERHGRWGDIGRRIQNIPKSGISWSKPCRWSAPVGWNEDQENSQDQTLTIMRTRSCEEGPSSDIQTSPEVLKVKLPMAMLNTRVPSIHLEEDPGGYSPVVDNASSEDETDEHSNKQDSSEEDGDSAESEDNNTQEFCLVQRRHTATPTGAPRMSIPRMRATSSAPRIATSNTSDLDDNSFDDSAAEEEEGGHDEDEQSTTEESNEEEDEEEEDDENEEEQDDVPSDDNINDDDSEEDCEDSTWEPDEESENDDQQDGDQQDEDQQDEDTERSDDEHQESYIEDRSLSENEGSQPSTTSGLFALNCKASQLLEHIVPAFQNSGTREKHRVCSALST